MRIRGVWGREVQEGLQDQTFFMGGGGGLQFYSGGVWGGEILGGF